jgi:hypothetical protein
MSHPNPSPAHRFQPGVSGNPGGVRKDGQPRFDARSIARTYTREAIECLAKACRKGSVPAAVALLDRGWGKSEQTVDFKVLLEKKLTELNEGELLELRGRMTALTALPAPVIDCRDDETTVGLDVGTTDEGKIE